MSIAQGLLFGVAGVVAFIVVAFVLAWLITFFSGPGD